MIGCVRWMRGRDSGTDSGLGMTQTAEEWAAGGQEEMAEKYFKPKNATLSLCKMCGLKVKSDDFDMKEHIVKKCEKC